MSNLSTSKIPVPEAKYSMLNVNGKKVVANRYLYFNVLLLFLCLMILAMVLIMKAVYEQPVYPKRSHRKDVPLQWLNRAINYDSIDTYNINVTENALNKQDAVLNNFKLVCYYAFPSEEAIMNDYPRILYPHNIEPNLCTHINLAFASVVNHSIYLEEYYLNLSKTVINMKQINKDLKVLLSIGGADNEKGFPEMVKDHEHRKIFIKSIDTYVRDHKFDGIDLDWEFPNMNPGNDLKQRLHFTQLLREIRDEINRQDKHKFLLSVAVAAPHFIVDLAYDVAYMNEYVDFINLMTYDFHFYSKATPFTGLNAPLYSSHEVGYFSTLNINYTAHYWHAKGMEKSKIIIGLPTFGHSFKLINPKNNGLYAPVRDYGHLGRNGFIDSYDICWFLNENKLKPSFDLASKSPYASKSTEWISYEDPISLTFKADYIKLNNFGGAMILSLNTDDHVGYCKLVGNPTYYPLTKRVKAALNDQQL